MKAHVGGSIYNTSSSLGAMDSIADSALGIDKDVMRYFAGDVRRVQAFLTRAPGRSVWSNASINLEFASTVGYLMGSYDMFGGHTIEAYEVAGNQRRFVLDNVYESLKYYPHKQEELRVYRNSIMGGVRGFEDTIKQLTALILQMAL